MGVGFGVSEPAADPGTAGAAVPIHIDTVAPAGLSIQAFRATEARIEAPFDAFTYDHAVGESPYQFGHALLIAEAEPHGTIDLLGHYVRLLEHEVPRPPAPELEALPVSWIADDRWPHYTYSYTVADRSGSEPGVATAVWGQTDRPWSSGLNYDGRSSGVLTRADCVWMVGISTTDQRVEGEFHNVTDAAYEHRADGVRGYRYHEGEMGGLARFHTRILPATGLAATAGTQFQFAVQGPSLVRLTTWFDGHEDAVRLFDANGDRVPLHQIMDGGTGVFAGTPGGLLTITTGVQILDAHLFTDLAGEWRLEVDPTIGTDSAVDLLVADLSDLPDCG